jgi:hypothetical protein
VLFSLERKRKKISKSEAYMALIQVMSSDVERMVSPTRERNDKGIAYSGNIMHVGQYSISQSAQSSTLVSSARERNGKGIAYSGNIMYVGQYFIS